MSSGCRGEKELPSATRTRNGCNEQVYKLRLSKEICVLLLTPKARRLPEGDGCRGSAFS